MGRALVVPEVAAVYPLVLFGSGDPATKELCAALDGNKIPYMLRDIRGNVNALKQMRRLGHETVPQLYNADDAYIGGCNTALAWLKTVTK